MAVQADNDELVRLFEQRYVDYVKALSLMHDAIMSSARGSGNRISVIAGSSLACSVDMEQRDGSAPEVVPGSPAQMASQEPPSPIAPVPSPRFRRSSSLETPRRARRSTDARGVNAAPRNRRALPGATSKFSLYGSESDTDEEAEDINYLILTSPAPILRAQTHETDELRVACVHKTLKLECFSSQDLVRHIQSLQKKDSGPLIALLGDTWRHRYELSPAALLEKWEDELYCNPNYEVYTIGKNSCALNHNYCRATFQEGLENLGIIGNENEKHVLPRRSNSGIINKLLGQYDISEGSSVGRITILQEPSPIMLSKAHLNLRRHFDMDELISHLVTRQRNKAKTKAYVDRAFEANEINQRSFFFVFKYYAAVEEDLNPAPYQRFDRRHQDYRSPDHINIAECCSVLALSLEGPPIKHVQVRSSRRRREVQNGSLYDHFSPWNLLSIQAFADSHHSIRNYDSAKPLYSGPYAFLDSLAMEYRDAVKRFTDLNERITKLITPSNQFMFEVKLRDKLLFEDKYFTYSRRYFWAYNSLAIINDSIRAMTAAYKDTFTSEFWEGRHQRIWPLLHQCEHSQSHPGRPNSCDDEARQNYIEKLSLVRDEIERAINDLSTVYQKNDILRKEIKSLREQLYSGSSVMESRRAIEQGDNIKILTSVSMIFLPLTFVTSVFGITNFSYSPEDWRFAVTMVCVCVPFFVLILVLQTRRGIEMCKKVSGWFAAKFQGADEMTKHRLELQALDSRDDDSNARMDTWSSHESEVDGERTEARRRTRRRFGKRHKSSAAREAEVAEAARGPGAKTDETLARKLQNRLPKKWLGRVPARKANDIEAG